MYTSKRIFRWVGILLAVFLLAGLGLADTSAADATWQATYWNNRTLSGNPVLVRQEAELNYDWGLGSPAPAVEKNDFSARWTRTVNFAGGNYQFRATADDGVRVWVDNTLIIDSWVDSEVRTLTGNVSLAAGDHVVKMEYYEGKVYAVAKLTWTSAPVVIHNWRGEYFNNQTLSGEPVLVRDDGSINFNWGSGSPAGNIPTDHFSVRWSRNLDFGPGRYRFSVATDDGVRLWVDGQLLINEWHDRAGSTRTAEIYLKGITSVRMEYFENMGAAVARLSWSKVSEPAPVVTYWRGEYFNNKDLAGNPAVVRDDGSINFNWGNGAPAGGMNADNFSVRWTRSLNLAAGRYRFTTTTDDGVRLWVNNQLIIDKWMTQTATTYSAEIDLAAGSVPVRMEYFENGGHAQASLSWTQISSTPPPPSSSGTAIVTAFRLNVRYGPGTGFGIITKINQGTVVQLLGRNEAATWVYVQLPNGTQGWVSASYLQSSTDFATLPLWTGSPPSTGTGGAPTATVTAYYLNVRSGPGISYNILTVTTRNTVVTMTHRNAAATWVRVILPSGLQGWVSASYLQSATPFSTLPLWTG